MSHWKKDGKQYDPVQGRSRHSNSLLERALADRALPKAERQGLWEKYLDWWHEYRMRHSALEDWHRENYV